MENIENYLKIQDIRKILPDTTQLAPFGYIDRGRGGTTFLNSGKPIQFLALIEFTPEAGPRGRHKHACKQELFYLVSGSLKGRYWLLDEVSACEHIHTAGTLITLEPGLFHTFECMNGPALALEFSPQAFDLKDHFYPDQ